MLDINNSLKNKLNALPTKPGVYLFQDQKGKILYIGKAKILRNRVRSYFQKSRSLDPRLTLLVNKIHDFEFIITDSNVEALILEANLIKEHKPRFNIDLKDDKSFPFIRVTHEDFPQIFATRTIIRDGSIYFGPYTNTRDMRNALGTLKKIFVIRSCKYDLNEQVVKNKKIPLCLEYYIKKCKGPCQQLQSRDEYMQMITRVKEFLRGKTSGLKDELEQEMKNFATAQNYEEAARIRDNIEVLDRYRNTQKVVLQDTRDRDLFAIASEDDDACAVIFKIREGKIINRVHYYISSILHRKRHEVQEQVLNQYYSKTNEIPQDVLLTDHIEQADTIETWLNSRVSHSVKIHVPRAGEKKKLMRMCEKNARYLLEDLKLQKMKAKDQIPYILKSLQRDLRLKQPPKRIECFDISNIQGSDPVGSMVCFVKGKPKKREYRKFSIQTKNTPDDFAMMREVVHRRYKRLLKEGRSLPDLIIVDGGKGQLSSALTELHKLNIKDIPIIGLAKKLEEIFFPGSSEAQMLPRTSSGLKLLQRIRDEAHRFAVTYHRNKRSKRTLTSSLEKISGIGPKRRNDLIKIFGSVKKIKELSLKELQTDGKLPVNLAKAVFNYYHSGEQKSSVIPINRDMKK